MVNLLSNDVARFDYASMLLNTMWTAPLLTIIVAILLWFEIGYSGLIGISIVFIVVPLQCKFSYRNLAEQNSIENKV